MILPLSPRRPKAGRGTEQAGQSEAGGGTKQTADTLTSRHLPDLDEGSCGVFRINPVLGE